MIGSLALPLAGYKTVLGGLALLVLAGVTAFIIQVLIGMGVTGLSVPVAWAVYIPNFMSLLPGWHTIIFAPYFVAGAIHQGLGMVIIYCLCRSGKSCTWS